MKRLTCEMCGSVDLVKDGGVFVCQTCGTKYSVEEAKKMMVEGTVEVRGTVEIDRKNENAQLINNYLEMCKTAQESLDTASVVEYSDKILEIEPDNYEAWVYRALACGWKSSLSDMKTGQVITAAKRATHLAPEEKKYIVAEAIYEQGKQQILSHLKTALSLDPLGGKKIQNVAMVMKAWIELLDGIPYLSSEIMENDIKYCDSLYATGTNKERQLSAAFIVASDFYNNEKKYNDEMRERLQEKINTVSKERDELYARRRQDYWKEHENERVSLEKEKEGLISQVKTLQSELDAENEKVDNCQKELASMFIEFDSLGMFKAKEKKELQAKIDEAKEGKRKLVDQVTPVIVALEEKIRPIQARINEIETEFNKIR